LQKKLKDHTKKLNCIFISVSLGFYIFIPQFKIAIYLIRINTKSKISYNFLAFGATLKKWKAYNGGKVITLELVAEISTCYLIDKIKPLD